MARPVWSGTISFGMVSLPVKLVSAVRRKTVSFNQLDSDSMARIRYRKVSAATGDEVPAERIVRAAHLGGDQYVIVSDEELDALAPERSTELAIEAFVPADQIDPLRYDASYHVLPDANAKPYALLAEALGGTGRVGIGRFVMRQKEHLAAVRSDGTRLQVSTLVFDDEIIDVGSLDEFEVLETVELTARESEMAATLVEAMSDDIGSFEFVDEYRAAVDELVASKAQGRAITTTASDDAEPRSNVIDLAKALEESLAQATAAKGRHPSARATASTASSDPARKRPAKKAAGNKTAKGTASTSTAGKGSTVKGSTTTASKTTASKTKAAPTKTATRRPAAKKSA